MLAVSNLEYDSEATVLFQRLSVCATSLVLVSAMMHATKAQKDSVKGLTAFLLVVANAGLIMVDNIHFQYNSILLGRSQSRCIATTCCLDSHARVGSQLTCLKQRRLAAPASLLTLSVPAPLFWLVLPFCCKAPYIPIGLQQLHPATTHCHYTSQGNALAHTVHAVPQRSILATL